MDIPWNPVETCKKKVSKHESNYWYYAVENWRPYCSNGSLICINGSEQGHGREYIDVSI